MDIPAIRETPRIVRATFRRFRHALAEANGDPKIKNQSRGIARCLRLPLAHASSVWAE